MASPEKYFLVTYNLRDRSVQVDDFGKDFDKAAAYYSMLERRHADDDVVEVVLLGADSEETIHKTHSHYFVRRTADLFERFLRDEAPAISSR